MICITAAFPFVPAELNIAHAASTYVPADVFCRLMKITGYDAVLISATDYHSIYASQDGINTDIPLCNFFHDKYIKFFERLNIKFDYYIKTSDIEHEQMVINCFKELLKRKQIYVKDSKDYICKTCGCCLPERFVLEDGEKKICKYCHNDTVFTKIQPHYYLKVSKRKDEVLEIAYLQKQSEIKNMIIQFAQNELDDWDFTRYNKLGVQVPDNIDQSFYIWFDSLIAYFSMMNMVDKPINRTVHFIGKNIVYYHSVILPYLHDVLYNDSKMINISARGFLDFEHSDKELINVEKACNDYHPDFIRFYLLFKVKDNISDYSFKKDDFEKVIRYYCCKKIGGFFLRIWKILKKNEVLIDNISNDIEISKREIVWDIFLKKIFEHLEGQRVHEVLRLVMEYMDDVLSWVGNLEYDAYRVKNINLYIKKEAARMVCFIAAYMPELANKYTIFEKWVPQNLIEVEKFEKYSLKEEKEIVTL